MMVCKFELVALAVLSLALWGGSGNGGKGAPFGNGYTKIYSAYGAFVALKAYGSITA
jgi:hypothetical protein